METKDAMEDMELELFNTLKTMDRLLKTYIHIKLLTNHVLQEVAHLELMELLS